MNKPKGGLGRGLGSLIGGAPASSPAMIMPNNPDSSVPDLDVSGGDLSIHYVAPAAIRVNPRQPRTYFENEGLEELKDSIAEHGILQPLVVMQLGNGHYELIAGERRLRAATALGLDSIPVVVRPAADDRAKLELALIENIQRRDLNAVEEAKAYQALVNDFGLTHEQIAKQVGKGESTITNSLRLLNLDEDVLQALMEGRISRSHARTLLAEPIVQKRRELFEQMLTGKITVRQAEAKAGSKRRASAAGKDPNLLALEAELRERLGTKVTIEAQGTTGKISIHYYSKEDLKDLINRLSGHAS